MTPVTCADAESVGPGPWMTRPLTLDPDRLFPADAVTRAIARRLYGEVASLPIVSPHGHCDPEWFAADPAFADAARLLLAPHPHPSPTLYTHATPPQPPALPP